MAIAILVLVVPFGTLIIDFVTTEKLDESMQFGMSHALKVTFKDPSKTPLIGGIEWFAGVVANLQGFPSMEQLLHVEGENSPA